MSSPTLNSAADADPITVAKKTYQAYVDKNRTAIEQLIVDDFHFISPLNNRIDRRTYFARCWPNSENIADFKFIHLVNEGDRVFVTYEGHSRGGKGFRNTEILTVRRGKLGRRKSYRAWRRTSRRRMRNGRSRTETTAVCAGWQRRERLRRVEGANWPGGKAAGARSQGGQTAEDQPSVPGQ